MIYLIGFCESLSAFWMGLVYILNVHNNFFTLHTIMITYICQNKQTKKKLSTLKECVVCCIAYIYVMYRHTANTKHTHWHQLSMFFFSRSFFVTADCCFAFIFSFYGEFRSCQMDKNTFVSSKHCAWVSYFLSRFRIADGVLCFNSASWSSIVYFTRDSKYASKLNSMEPAQEVK